MTAGGFDCYCIRQGVPLNISLVKLLFPAMFLSIACLLPMELSAARMITISDRVKFYPPRIDPKYEKLQSFLKAADGAISSASSFKAGEKGLACSVIISGTDLKNGFEVNTVGNETRIFLAEDAAEIDRKPGIQSMIVSSLLLCRFGMKPDNGFAKVPEWMGAALLYKTEKRKNTSILQGIVTYQGVRALCISGSAPDLWNLINCPLEAGDGPSFRLYAEACLLMMDAISRFPGGGRDAFTSLLKSALDDEKAESSLRNVLHAAIKKSGVDYFLSSEKENGRGLVENWYGTVVRNSSVSIFYPGTSGYALRRIEELEEVGFEQVPVDAKSANPKPEEEGDVPRTFKLVDFGTKWQEIKNPEKTVMDLQRKFSDLSNQLPPSFQDKINGFITLLKKLKDGRRDDFADEYRKLRQKFEAEMARLGEIEKFLDEGERKFIPFGTRCSFELEYLESAGGFAARFWPELEAELEKEEGKSR